MSLRKRLIMLFRFLFRKDIIVVARKRNEKRMDYIHDTADPSFSKLYVEIIQKSFDWAKR